MEKKPNWSSRSQEVQYTGSELLCFDRPQVTEHPHRAYCRCQQEPPQACGPVHLIPSLCCEETYSIEHGCIFPSHSTLYEGNADSVADMISAYFGPTSHSACRELAETWPLMQTPPGSDSAPVCEPYPERIGGDADTLKGDTEEPSILHTNSVQNISEETEYSKHLQLLELEACQGAEGNQPEEEHFSCVQVENQEC